MLLKQTQPSPFNPTVGRAMADNCINVGNVEITSPSDYLLALAFCNFFPTTSPTTGGRPPTAFGPVACHL